MAELILHHFDASPFAEKVRLALGIKSLPWRSVEIPMIMPKPNLTALTGGYRKTPVLQVGAEIYCDTGLIIKQVESQFPEPALFSAGGEALQAALAAWSDQHFFEPGAALSMALNEEIPQPLLDDRKAFFSFMDFSELKSSVPHMTDQFLAQVAVVEDQLAHGQAYLAGGQVSMTDILGYFPLWMIRANVPGGAQWLEEFPRVGAWLQRMDRIGHGQRSEMPAEEALDIAKAASPQPGVGVMDNAANLRQGDHVTATPTDYGAVAVEGTLQTLDRRIIMLRRTDARVGEVNVYFPRAGFEVAASGS
ncbi:MAG: glutathione S-transferase family protein [Lysobacterales bacterium]